MLYFILLTVFLMFLIKTIFNSCIYRFVKGFWYCEHWFITKEASFFRSERDSLALVPFISDGQGAIRRGRRCAIWEQSIHAGVPQGSTLGPLLFNLYINDMAISTEDLQFVCFADDTTVFLVGDDLTELASAVNAELVKLDLWLQSNRLSLNITKYSLIKQKSWCTYTNKKC